VKILFVTDLHGSTLVFQKALMLADRADVDVLIVGGDLSGKRLLPIVPISATRYRGGEPYKQKDDSGTTIETMVSEEISKDQLKQHCARLEAKGHYWHIAEETEIVRLNESPDELKRLWERKICERIEKWASLATSRLPEGMSCLWTGGNDDEGTILESLRAIDLGRFQYAEGRVIQVDDYEIVSLGYSNITPFGTPRELDERELLGRLEELGKQVSTTDKLLLNVHVPPVNCSTLDSVISRDTGDLVSVGSFAVRTFIENIQPLADFAGHVHEGRGVGLIGRTHIFNPGSEYQAGILNAFVVTASEDKIVDYAHYSR
jgi:Icc-related predicted phosphoesterase